MDLYRAVVLEKTHATVGVLKNTGQLKNKINDKDRYHERDKPGGANIMYKPSAHPLLTEKSLTGVRATNRFHINQVALQYDNSP